MISSREAAVTDTKVARWAACDPAVQDQARRAFLQALSSPHPNVSHTSAQVLAAYGAVDIPAKRFPQLIPTLVQGINDANTPEQMRKSALECIGYMAETLSSDEVAPEEVDQILSPLIGGMQTTNSNTIRLAATEALKHTVDLANANFEREPEREMIMASIKTSATACDDAKVRQEAYECLTYVCELYYALLSNHIMDIFQYSTAAIKQDDDEVGLKAIEFWLQVCEEEVDRNGRIADGEDDVLHLNLLKRAYPNLLPIIMEHTLTKQSEDVDDDEWNMYQAGCEFIHMLALCVTDEIVDAVLPFITRNIGSADWRLKEAAISVFGFIMEGPSDEKVHPLVRQATNSILGLTKEQNDHVSLAALWTMAQICEFHSAALAKEEVVSLMESVMAALDRESPMLVEKASMVVINIALACEERAEEETNLLSNFFVQIMTKLLTVAIKPSLQDTNAVHALYEAAINVVMFAAKDMYQFTKDILLECVQRLELALNPNTNTQVQEKQKLQGSLCSVIGVCIEKYSVDDLTPELCDRIMTALLTMVKEEKNLSASEGYFAISKLTTALEGGFTRYVEHVLPYLRRALENFQDKGTCTHVLAILGDLFRSLGPKPGEAQVAHPMAPYCDDIVTRILVLLQSSDAAKTLKPEAISLFSDIVLALKKDFGRYSESVMLMLATASQTQLSSEDDEEHDEFVWDLREKIVEVYAAIIIAFREDNIQDQVQSHVTAFVGFALAWGVEENHTEDITKHTVALLGDLAKAYGAPLVQQLESHESVKKIVAEAQGSDNEDLRQYAAWTVEILKQVRQGT